MSPSKKYFSHPSLVICFLATPPIKLKLGWQIDQGTINIANHLNQSIWWADKKHSAPLRSYLLHSSSLQVHGLASPSTSHCRLSSLAEWKPICWAKPAHFDFSSSNFTVQDQIMRFSLATSGPACLPAGLPLTIVNGETEWNDGGREGWTTVNDGKRQKLKAAKSRREREAALKTITACLPLPSQYMTCRVLLLLFWRILFWRLLDKEHAL